MSDIAKAVAERQTRRERAGDTKSLDSKTRVARKRQVNRYDPDGTRSELIEAKTLDGAPAVEHGCPAALNE